MAAPRVRAADLPSAEQAQFPNEDAVVLRQVQSWTVQPDGGVVMEEHQWVKLFDDRAWGRYADPRVDYLDGAEKVELLAAKAHLPDGTVVDIPPYSTNVVSPDGVSKWPTMAGWRQVVYTFSGVQNGAVLELHYKRTSPKGMRRWLDGEFRIGDVDPVIERVVEVTLPADGRSGHRPDEAGSSGHRPDQGLRYQLDRAEKWASFEQQDKDDRTTYRWRFANVPSDADEPGCPPWRQRCGRLRFTTCPSAEEWAGDLIRAVESPAEETKNVLDFAHEACEDEVDDAGRARSVAKKLRERFNAVDDWRGWAARASRPVEEVFASGYGSRVETAALLLSALRVIGLEARPLLAVDRDTFSETAPVDGELAGMVIEVATADGPLRIDAAAGPINPNGAWRERDLLSVDQGKLVRAPVAAAPDVADAVHVRGYLTIGENGEKLTGNFNVELTGMFVDAESLRSDDAKKSRVQAIVAGIVPGLKVGDYSVSHLSEGRFVAHATAEAADLPGKVYDRRMLALAGDTPGMTEVHLPLDRPARRTALRLPGAIEEDIRLRIELPDGWKAVVLPEGLESPAGEWGRISQSVQADGKEVRIVRQMEFAERTIAPEDYAALRDAVLAARSDAARTLVIEKTE